MSDWMDAFISQCLVDIPQGRYRTRTEKELRDHLESLAHDLEGMGYASEEARALAQARMGDPAELARRYAQEWKRRSALRRIITAEMFLYVVCIACVGYLYVWNAQNFGKSVVAYWGIVAWMTAAGGIVQLLYSLSGTNWTAPRWSCLILALLQLPPIWCWMVLGGPFEMSGVMLPGWAGLSAHLLLCLWGAVNWRMLSQLQTEDGPAQIQNV